MEKKAQIQITFNWIYILIAGALILLFFVGIVAKQKVASEEKLSAEVIQILGSIFTAAEVSEKTKIPIDTSGLADYPLYFDCKDGVTEFGIKGKSANKKNNIDPIFAPTEIKTTKLLLWSLPYKLPYKIMDFLFISSVNNMYVLMGNDLGFAAEFMNVTEGFNTVYIQSNTLPADFDPGKDVKIKIIDPIGNVLPGLDIPESLASLDDEDVSAVSFGLLGVTFYQKKGSGWKEIGSSELLSLPGKRNVAKYGAIFSGNKNVYECNMKKAIRRVIYVSEVYTEKAREIEQHHNSELDLCKVKVSGLFDLVESHKISAQKCSVLFPEICSELVSSASELQERNQLLRSDVCIPLY